MKIGNKIRKYRKEIKINQSDLAQLIGVSRESVVKYENNQRLPSLDVVKRIAHVFNISLDELIEDTDDVIIDDQFFTFLDNMQAGQNRAFEISEYALNNPTISRDSDVGKLINNGDFQMFIISLIRKMLKMNSDERSRFLRLMNTTNNINATANDMIDMMWICDIIGYIGLLNHSALQRVFSLVADMCQVPRNIKKSPAEDGKESSTDAEEDQH